MRPWYKIKRFLGWTSCVLILGPGVGFTLALIFTIPNEMADHAEHPLVGGILYGALIWCAALVLSTPITLTNNIHLAEQTPMSRRRYYSGNVFRYRMLLFTTLVIVPATSILTSYVFRFSEEFAGNPLNTTVNMILLIFAFIATQVRMELGPRWTFAHVFFPLKYLVIVVFLLGMAGILPAIFIGIWNSSLLEAMINALLDPVESGLSALANSGPVGSIILYVLSPGSVLMQSASIYAPPYLSGGCMVGSLLIIAWQTVASIRYMRSDAEFVYVRWKYPWSKAAESSLSQFEYLNEDDDDHEEKVVLLRHDEEDAGWPERGDHTPERYTLEYLEWTDRRARGISLWERFRFAMNQLQYLIFVAVCYSTFLLFPDPLGNIVPGFVGIMAFVPLCISPLMMATPATTRLGYVHMYSNNSMLSCFFPVTYFRASLYPMPLRWKTLFTECFRRRGIYLIGMDLSLAGFAAISFPGNDFVMFLQILAIIVLVRAILTAERVVVEARGMTGRSDSNEVQFLIFHSPYAFARGCIVVGLVLYMLVVVVSQESGSDGTDTRMMLIVGVLFANLMSIVLLGAMEHRHFLRNYFTR